MVSKQNSQFELKSDEINSLFETSDDDDEFYKTALG